MNDPSPVLSMMADTSLAWHHRLGMLKDIVNNQNPETEAIVRAILDNCGKQSAQNIYETKIKRLDAVLREIQEGPMRSATFVELLPKSNGNQASIALVLLDDGTEAYTIVPKEEGIAGLRQGDRVVLDGKGRVLLHRAASSLKIGEVAHFERRIDDRHVEVTLRAGGERSVILATQDLMSQIKEGKVEAGAAIIVNVRRALAIAAIPPEDGLSHYRFLDRRPVPDVHVDRDIGAPPRCIEEVARHVRVEMTQPHLRRQYRLRRCYTKLLCGPSGTGKSQAIAAIHRRLYELMSEVTGIPIEKLPHRVVCIRQSQVLSMWLGESEKNWQRALQEACQLADESFTDRAGQPVKLPVLVVLEEVDGMGRARGQEAIQDRILTTVLDALDPAKLEMRDRLLVVLATTNEPHLIDPALVRRLGGSIENFSRLKRRSFIAVLSKLTHGLPIAARNGSTPEEIWKDHIENLAAWFFSPNTPDPGVVELTYAGSTNPVLKHRRDFLTGALVDRAVQQAAAEAVQAELEGSGHRGITFEQLTRAFESQLRGIIDNLREHNVGSYTDLPDAVRVATLRRVPQPAHLPFEFHRHLLHHHHNYERTHTS